MRHNNLQVSVILAPFCEKCVLTRKNLSVSTTETASSVTDKTPRQMSQSRNVVLYYNRSHFNSIFPLIPHAHSLVGVTVFKKGLMITFSEVTYSEPSLNNCDDNTILVLA